MQNTTGTFQYKNLAQLEADIARRGLDLGASQDVSALTRPVPLGAITAHNAMVAHPMEGGDGTTEGAPTALTFRKYERAAAGGVGLIWLEAVSVRPEARANPRQLLLSQATLPGFRELATRIRHAAESAGFPAPPVLVQLNHSGRYSKPNGTPAPLTATRKPELDARFALPPGYPLLTDAYLEALADDFVAAAKLAHAAGFDGVDIKACHGYLLGELLSAFDREGPYGGNFANRTRLMLDTIDRVRAAIPDPAFVIASRINLYDALPQSRGFGAHPSDPAQVDLTEPLRLCQELVRRGVTLINVTMGNPYFIPHINRPYDKGAYAPPEAPLDGVYRLIHYTREMQRALPEAAFVGVGYSWLRTLAPYVAAWALETRAAKLIGFGRQFIAYPHFARDIIETGRFNKRSVCVSCSICSRLKADIGTCGCVVRDADTYLPLYRETYGQTRGNA